MSSLSVVDDHVMGVADCLAFLALTLVQLGVGAVVVGASFDSIVMGGNVVGSLAVAGALAIAIGAFQARWLALPLMRRPRPLSPAPGLRVGVATTFVPSHEPLALLERTLQGLVTMDYRHDTWVLDEQDDARVRALCERLGARHYTRHGRPNRLADEGVFERASKHGNYNAWLHDVGFERYDVVVAFDPDHLPESNFLTATLGYLRDPAIAYVQAPQAYGNQAASWVARGAAEETLGYYSATQMTAYGVGFPIVVGCHNVHRVTALRQVGGFACHEADDLLVTMHYRAAGWRGVYVPEILARGLAPETWAAYARQQRRWARSALDVKLRALPRLARRMPWGERLAAIAHGIFYLQSLLWLMVAAVLLATWPFLGAPGLLHGDVVLLTLALIGVLAVTDQFRQRFFLGRGERGVHWRAAVVRVLKWPWLLLGALDVVFSRRGYVITPKVADGHGVEPLEAAPASPPPRS